LPLENIELCKEISKQQNGRRKIEITEVYDNVLLEESKTAFAFMTFSIFPSVACDCWTFSVCC